MYLQQGYSVGAGALLFHNILEFDADIRRVGEHFLKSTQPALQFWAAGGISRACSTNIPLDPDASQTSEGDGVPIH